MKKFLRERQDVIYFLSNLGYVLACMLLYLIAFWIIVGAIWSTFRSALFTQGFTIYDLLDEVTLIVFSIALIDISKYLLIEEMLVRESNTESAKKERRAVTKFTIIIVNALFLKGLVFAIETTKVDIQKILYPISLLVAGILLIIGLGIYQKLNASAEGELSE